MAEGALDYLVWLAAMLGVTFGTVTIHIVNGAPAKIIPQPSYTPAEFAALVAERGAA